MIKKVKIRFKSVRLKPWPWRWNLNGSAYLSLVSIYHLFHNLQFGRYAIRPLWFDTDGGQAFHSRRFHNILILGHLEEERNPRMNSIEMFTSTTASQPRRCHSSNEIKIEEWKNVSEKVSFVMDGWQKFRKVMQVFFPLSIEEKRERSGRELGGSNTRTVTQFVEKLHESFHHLSTNLKIAWKLEHWVNVIVAASNWLLK